VIVKVVMVNQHTITKGASSAIWSDGKDNICGSGSGSGSDGGSGMKL